MNEKYKKKTIRNCPGKIMPMTRSESGIPVFYRIRQEQSNYLHLKNSDLIGKIQIYHGLSDFHP